MGQYRFDTLTRALSQARDRRGVVRFLAGSALGGVLRPLAGQGETAAHNTVKKCRKIEDKGKRQQCIRKAKTHNQQHKAQTLGPAPECRTPAECPQPTEPCAEATCSGGKCGMGFAPASRVCREARCVGVVAENAATCTGTATSCPPSPGGEVCPPYACVAGACTTSCSGDTDCHEFFAWCDAGTCKQKQSDGTECSASTPQQCGSGFCVDGHCCRTASCPTGQSCTSGQCR